MLAYRYHTRSVALPLRVAVWSRVHPAGAVLAANDQYENDASSRSPFWTPLGTMSVVPLELVEPTRLIGPGASVAVAVGVAVRVAVAVKVAVAVAVSVAVTVAVGVAVRVMVGVNTAVAVAV